MDLKGTVAVVTGGNGGLGQRICHALAAQGCHIAVVYAQSKDQADGVARGQAEFTTITSRSAGKRVTDWPKMPCAEKPADPTHQK